jgi:hypothetical protein
LSSNGSLFTVGSGVTLKLGNNITLRGLSDNTSPLVRVESGGKLEMNSGSKISGNANISSGASGGGVYVNGGTFAMSGGEISGNSAHSGGGVHVSNGTFTKQSGGIIYGADASGTLKNTATGGYSYGHAVYVSGSQMMRNFTVGTGVSLDSSRTGAAGGWAESMPDNLPLNESLLWLDANASEGGAYTVAVSANESLEPRTLYYDGKPVSITLLGGTAERTVSLSSSGPLFTVGSGVTLKLGNNIILRGLSDNTSALVLVESGGKLEMNSGSKINGNANTFYEGFGGGVYVNGGTFAMSGGEISGSSAYSGGGVYIYSGTFTKQSGGIIYGANASGTLKNTATGGYSYGHAVYVSGSQMLNFTVGTGVSLDSTKSGAAEGWAESIPDNLSLNESLAWLSANAVENGAYTITLRDGETIGPQMLSYSGKTVRITLLGDTEERTVSLSSSGALFTVGSGVTLKLSNNITLQGLSGNTSSLVRIESGGKLEMNSGSKISGNTATGTSGGGVYVNGGTFTMSGGEISGNNVSATSAYGGGVYVASGAFTMSGGEISGNSAASTGQSYGGGVYVYSGTFNMNGGEISDNNAASGGGGVFVVSGGTFNMSGGEISGNKATSSSSAGGGVYVDGTFTMSGGTISGNTAYRGGGVFVYGTFTKQSGGTIYGSAESDSLKNTAQNDNSGHAVYVSSGSKKRNSTAEAGVTMDSATSGSAGGWE